MFLGKKLLKLRVKRGLTQRVLSAVTGMTEAYISYLESGRKKGTVETLQKLAAALDVSLESLFRGAPSLAKKSGSNSQ